MQIRLSSSDVLQLTKAARTGNLDTDKVDCLRQLARNYKAPTSAGEYDMYMFKRIVEAALSVTPTPYKRWVELTSEDVKVRVKERFGSLEAYYSKCVEDIFTGVVSMYILGMDRSEKGDTMSSEDVFDLINEYIAHKDDSMHVILRDYWDEYR